MISKKLIAVLGLFSVILYASENQWMNLINETRNVFLHERNKNISHYKSFKKILYWNTFFGVKDFYFGTGAKPFIDAKCPVNNCYITYDKHTDRVENFDAIIFHMYDFKTLGIYLNSKKCNERMIKSLHFPEKRNLKQRYVFYYEESPETHNADLHIFNYIFNLTLTYRRDSDIFRPYGYFVPKNITNTIEYMESYLNITWKSPIYNEKEIDSFVKEIQNKTDAVAWLVSNCNAPSRRDLYVKQLQKHIKVDIYGKCGNMTCPMSTECFKIIEKKYKFYLSFENSLCKDYVTEKLFNAMMYNIVPVVYGGADYSKIAPPNSYINVNDFRTPKELAEYLIYLTQHDEEYVKYFWWKSEYKIERDVRGCWCKLCSIINSLDLPENTYEAIDQWYSPKDICHKPNWSFPIETKACCTCRISFYFPFLTVALSFQWNYYLH